MHFDFLVSDYSVASYDVHRQIYKKFFPNYKKSGDGKFNPVSKSTADIYIYDQ